MHNIIKSKIHTNNTVIINFDILHKDDMHITYIEWRWQGIPQDDTFNSERFLMTDRVASRYLKFVVNSFF